ncbi:hypothetical protein OC846_001025 [Tilletia horrida]|uniref:Nudix hydrolase domain-containing protein n=1 Tax=Tilletia horrida TaxID=155126 RepID=A0AAN6GVW8_9BASI|nr:hypothetical protein OC846_001025 [Tilletia horrida]
MAPVHIKERSFGVVPIVLGEPAKVLLIKQASGGKQWGIPKGHAEQGETALQAAVRELEEETGLKVSRFLQDPSTKSRQTTSSLYARNSTSGRHGVKAEDLDTEQDAIHGEPYQNPSKNDQWKANTYFVGLFDKGVAVDELKLQEEEVEDAEWLALDDAVQRCTYEEGKNVVKTVQDWLSASASNRTAS